MILRDKFHTQWSFKPVASSRYEKMKLVINNFDQLPFRPKLIKTLFTCRRLINVGLNIGLNRLRKPVWPYLAHNYCMGVGFDSTVTGFFAEFLGNSAKTGVSHFEKVSSRFPWDHRAPACS